ncbi:hypothetical protein KL86DYS1_11585 [uncultured Dysgonomonas sp.]|uniref:Uncharacterized protein n=1 Tax=uncultured Dysgonomonas sp. TaxID=206096 RepID=A0A212J9R8_9BACT|nr:hypothetical protein KL86DYS1_11585 [uncultured Dysgonomonas sp.]
MATVSAGLGFIATASDFLSSGRGIFVSNRKDNSGTLPAFIQSGIPERQTIVSGRIFFEGKSFRGNGPHCCFDISSI